jgi:hypothetical protein
MQKFDLPWRQISKQQNGLLPGSLTSGAHSQDPVGSALGQFE